MESRLTRRAALAIPAVFLARQPVTRLAEQGRSWITAPVGFPDAAPGDGFHIGHGFQCENTWFTPGWWHTGEDWYATTGDTAGAVVLAVAAGEVVYADFDYPGRVVIIRHADDLYSVYGHVDYELEVATGQEVETGAMLGTVLRQAARRARHQAPSHLHFEMRRFLIRDDVNGASPSYGVNCGIQCPPGPGYWPMSAPELPAAKGWLNPLHLRFGEVVEQGVEGLSIRVQAGYAGMGIPMREEPDDAAAETGRWVIEAGTEVPVVELVTGDPSTEGTGAESYDLWFRIASDDAAPGWVKGALPSDRETGTDGRPSSIDLPFVVVAG